MTNGVLMWDVWNEPDNTNDNSYGEAHTIKTELPKARKIAIIQALLPHVFQLGTGRRCHAAAVVGRVEE